MKAILIPVKEFHEAKKRLAPHRSAADRAALAEAMCEDLFSIVRATSCADRVFVISKEPRALMRARKLGSETIVESSPRMERDIDELDDLRRVSTLLRPSSATAGWLLERDFNLGAPPGGMPSGSTANFREYEIPHQHPSPPRTSRLRLKGAPRH